MSLSAPCVVAAKLGYGKPRAFCTMHTISSEYWIFALICLDSVLAVPDDTRGEHAQMLWVGKADFGAPKGASKVFVTRPRRVFKEDPHNTP